MIPEFLTDIDISGLTTGRRVEYEEMFRNGWNISNDADGTLYSTIKPIGEVYGVYHGVVTVHKNHPSVIITERNEIFYALELGLRSFVYFPLYPVNNSD